jgi:electron-transferring-flavoprotein dehydrogenase
MWGRWNGISLSIRHFRQLSNHRSRYYSYGVQSCLDDDGLSFDVAIVGGGPAGLSAATRLRQLSSETGMDLSVCVLEKGSEIGSHNLSGCVLETSALDELHPGWKEDASCPVRQEVSKDKMYYFTKSSAIRVPMAKSMKNKGNYVVSLSELTRWMAEKAEESGVEIFPGFAAQEALYGKGVSGGVTGVKTGSFGVDKNGNKKSTYSPGVQVHSKLTLIGEGCRGSLAESIMKQYSLREKNHADPPTYALGIKEIWKVRPERHQPGLVWHAIGYPFPHSVHGGAFCYHMENSLVAIGLITALDYENPYLSPYWEFQKLKLHPLVSKLIEDGECIEYGARCLSEGGLQSLPHLEFPGGALMGDSAGMLNTLKIKGVHNAMKSGILAAEHAFKALKSSTNAVTGYHEAVENSRIREELYRARNIRPAFSQFGRVLGMMYSGMDAFLLRGGAPWTLRMKKGMEDHQHLKTASEVVRPEYPKPDGVKTFSISDSLYRSGTNHEHDQPCHLKLRNPNLPGIVSYPLYGGPEEHYCPAQVYEYSTSTGQETPRLLIHAQNCLHCKACDIKDPSQNIRWSPPEGGGGPHYKNM